MTVGALLTASFSYVAAYSDTPRMNATQTVTLTASACSPTTSNGTQEVQLNADLDAAETVALVVNGENAFTFPAPRDGNCLSQTVPLSNIKPITVAGNSTVTAAIWSGTPKQPYFQIFSASGVAAAALTCPTDVKASSALLALGEPRNRVVQECLPLDDLLKITYRDNGVTYYEPRDSVTQGNYVMAVHYDDQAATESALLVWCGWRTPNVTKSVCYSYISSTLATNI